LFSELQREFGENSSSNSTQFQPSDDTLLRRFNTYFQTMTARTPEQVRTAQKIRYQVYCVENPLESSDKPDGLEADEFDSHAVQSLLVDRSNHAALGTVRLIMPLPHAPERSFAVQRLLDPDSLRILMSLPHHALAEVSRFSISQQFRRRTAKGSVPTQGEAAIANYCGPLMRLGLFRGLVHSSLEHGITHWCALMEPTLLRMFNAMAIRPRPLGPLVNFRGLRQPCYLDLYKMLDAVKRERPAIWEVMTDAGSFMARAEAA
jgi:N-acyl amino acid synthase of PEP-CTERM/exosortase system